MQLRPERLGIIDTTLETSPSEFAIIYGDQELPVHLNDDTTEFKPGVFVTTFTFLDEHLTRQGDGAYIELEPNATTGIQSFDDSTTFIEVVKNGSGVWIGLSPEGNFVKIHVEAGDPNPPVIAYGEGWKGTWIAGDDGLEILELCTPPYNPDNNIKGLSVLDPSLPVYYKAMVLSLVDIENTLNVGPRAPLVLGDGVLTVVEYLNRHNSPDISVAEIFLKGENRAVSNPDSDAAYCVMGGEGVFKVWYREGFEYIQVKKGDIVYIPRGTTYQDIGNDLHMVSVMEPALDPDRQQFSHD